jgi:hypothetical protein
MGEEPIQAWQVFDYSDAVTEHQQCVKRAVGEFEDVAATYI